MYCIVKELERALWIPEERTIEERKEGDLLERDIMADSACSELRKILKVVLEYNGRKLRPR